jgi:hypothetical protein
LVTYLNLHRTLGADLVNEVLALDNNWDQIDTKTMALTAGVPAGTGVVAPTVGLEAVDHANKNIAVWDGATWRAPVVETWGAWQAITLLAPFLAGANAPMLRISNAGQVEFGGDVQNGAQLAWPAGFSVINQNQFAAGTYAPTQTCVKCLGCSPQAAAGASRNIGAAFVSNAGGFLKIWAQLSGGAFAPNRVYLNGLRYYTSLVP